MRLFVFGSSLTSSYWNGAATYYRGIYKHLHALGHSIVFAEPDIYGRRDHPDEEHAAGEYAEVRVYRNRAELDAQLREAGRADLIVKHSGIGADDDYLAAAALSAAEGAPAGARPRCAYWDVDAPATLAEIEASPRHALRSLLPRYDFVFTYGGGYPVIRRFLALGAANCFPIYNGFDPAAHFPAPPAAEWRSDLTFVGHRLPDREARVEEFFFETSRRRRDLAFLLAGAGWESHPLAPNVRWANHAPTRLHNVINSSAGMVLNVNRESMARSGFSPPTRIFEAAGAAACVITDAWPGIELFFEPGREILPASNGAEVAEWLTTVTPPEARAMGERMRLRALEEHTYARRAARVHQILTGGEMLEASGSETTRGEAA